MSAQVFNIDEYRKRKQMNENSLAALLGITILGTVLGSLALRRISQTSAEVKETRRVAEKALKSSRKTNVVEAARPGEAAENTAGNGDNELTVETNNDLVDAIPGADEAAGATQGDTVQ